jgi:hypothetical protein
LWGIRCVRRPKIAARLAADPFVENQSASYN